MTTDDVLRAYRRAADVAVCRELGIDPAEVLEGTLKANRLPGRPDVVRVVWTSAREVPHADVLAAIDKALDRATWGLPLHRTWAGTPGACSTCDGGGCPDCTDPTG